MSARVFNPFSLTEMRRFRDAGRCVPDAEARLRVCRNLYGPVNHEETRAFVAKELAAGQERDADRWGFDFRRERPRTAGPGADRFLWVRVTAGTVPAAYGLRRMPFLGADFASKEAVSPLTTASATIPAILNTARTTVPVATPSCSPPTLAKTTDSRTPPPAPAPAPAPAPEQPKTVKRQASMTDFLKCRKRSAPSSAKAVDVPSSPAKRARTTASS